MSSDLLAEFDSFYSAPQKGTTNTMPALQDLFALSNSDGNGIVGIEHATSQWHGTDSTQPNNNRTPVKAQVPSSHGYPSSTQEDIWGAFETSGSDQPVQSLAHGQMNYPDPFMPNSNNRSAVDERPKVTRFHQIDLHKPSATRHSSSGGEVLFDAVDEMDEEDEFGEFETVQASPIEPQERLEEPLQDIFGSISAERQPPKIHEPFSLLDLMPDVLPHPQAPRSSSIQDRSELAASKTLSHAKQPSAAVTAWPTHERENSILKTDTSSPRLVAGLDDEWESFADFPSHTKVENSGIEADSWAWDTADKEIAPSPDLNSCPPPTNIPPPSILLTLFPPLFDLLQSTLFQAVAKQSFSLKNRIISDPSTINFLRAYLLIATVAARIIAGRKSRWKRDTLLSQAMRIGPAAAGGKGGMKLTGLDKAEITKEDREAADVIRVWKEQLGRLRSAIAIANTSMKDTSSHLVIPELSEVMHVKTQVGAMTAPRQCVICGLKRDERVSKVDIEVEDSFGEWWTEHWGHRACRNFWQEHESKLKQR